MLARGAVELFAAALVASVLGSMVGLGGGFIFVPILRLFLGFAPAEAAGTSLVLIVANSASGAFTYLLHKRVHVKIGLMVALGGLPSSILGAMLAVRMPP
ncbi:MAG: sulfite exporter TauE/SafE family protein, partial [Candidatus Eremiobacteraeota bacterium]|nr:sulfite exporter TauE/SafE family protein [Candidatus Eremiobacteraeota bacterium]